MCVGGGWGVGEVWVMGEGVCVVWVRHVRGVCVRGWGIPRAGAHVSGTAQSRAPAARIVLKRSTFGQGQGEGCGWAWA